MTENRRTDEGNGVDGGEPEPGSYWKRMYRDWRFWIGAILSIAPISIYALEAIWQGFRMVIGFPMREQLGPEGAPGPLPEGSGETPDLI